MVFYLVFALTSIWLVVLGWYDCNYRRLPNVLTLGGAAVFLVLQLAWGGIGWMLNGLLGGLVGGAFLLLPFIMRGAGAGDVKMFFAVGCLAGYPRIVVVMVLSSLFGLLLGIGMLIAGKADGSRLKHWYRCCTQRNYDREEGRKALRDRNQDVMGIPFGVAIAAAAWCTMALYAYYAR